MLTTTSFKNRLYYLGLLSVFALFTGYWFFLKEPSSLNDLENNAFALNHSALSNGVRLANYQYLVRTGNIQSQKGLNKALKINGLTYNNLGFPVADDLLAGFPQTPNTAQDCQAVWQRVLGPLQPELSISPERSRYWVDISVDKVCIYRNNRIKDKQIEYDAVKGLVSIVEIND